MKLFFIADLLLILMAATLLKVTPRELLQFNTRNGIIVWWFIIPLYISIPCCVIMYIFFKKELFAWWNSLS